MKSIQRFIQYSRPQSLIPSFSVKACVLFACVMLAGEGLSGKTLQAQERMFGGGRLLKRMFGGDSATKPQDKLKSQQADSSPAAKTSRPSKSAVPTPATSGRPAPGYRPAAPTGVSAHGNRLPQNELEQLQLNPTRSSPKATRGFGMLIQLRNEMLIVRQVSSQGNAAKAGIRSGDQIVSGGGIKFESLADFNGIGDILEDGDQLEFEIRRGSRTNKSMLTFGKVPEIGPTATNQNETSSNQRPTTPLATQPKQSLKRSIGDAINRISNQPFSSFLPSSKNIRHLPQNQNFSRLSLQSTEQSRVEPTIRDQQAEVRRIRREAQQQQVIENHRSSNLQIPPAAMSVLN